MNSIKVCTPYIEELLDKADEAYSQPSNLIPFGITPQLMNVGYAADFIDLSEKSTPGLDLTYDTVERIAPTLPYAYRYLVQEEKMTPERARLDMSKKLASYLMLLACNMHGCTIQIHKPSVRTRRKQNLNLVWAKSLTMTIGTKQQVDLLPSCIEAINVPKDTAEGFIFEPRTIWVKYKRGMGVDLFYYGLASSRNLLC